jgi:hypothetical protein
MGSLRRLLNRDKREIEHIQRALEESLLPNARIVSHKRAMDWIR